MQEDCLESLDIWETKPEKIRFLILVNNTLEQLVQNVPAILEL